MIVYKKKNGQATDVRFVSVSEADDIIYGEGDVLPDIETLHDAAYVTARDTEKANQVVKDKLAEVDAKSIRSLREWLASQADCPTFLKTHEANAQTERGKL